MPVKKPLLSDEERAKRLEDAARKIAIEDDPSTFERAFDRIARRQDAKPAPRPNNRDLK